MPRPDLSRVPVYYHQYINQVKQDDLSEAFRAQAENFGRFLDSIPAEKQDFRYAEKKWSVKDILQHIIDAERIFSYRALCFARKDTTPLPSFEENDYAANANAGKRSWPELVKEYRLVRQANEVMFDSFSEDQLQSSGIASNNPVYVFGIGYILVGHVAHHQRIIEERYL